MGELLLLELCLGERLPLAGWERHLVATRGEGALPIARQVELDGVSLASR